MNVFSLNEGFAVKESPMCCESPAEARLLPTIATVTLPCDVHMALMQAGRIKDPTLADYCKDIGWVEQRAWWFFRTFDRAELPEAEVTELVLTWVDTHAVIFLNGVQIGTSDSVHIPFVRDLTRYLKDGENELAVRVTTGLEQVRDEDLAELYYSTGLEPPIEPFPRRGDTRRAFVRRPQYSTGWDWAPRIATCGLNGTAQIRTMQGAAVRALTVSTVSANNDQALLHVTAEVWSPDRACTREAALTFTLTASNGAEAVVHTQNDVLLTSGTNFIDFTVTVAQPMLWWPNGSGEQPLYTAACTVTTENGGDTLQCRVGIRTLRLVIDKHEGRRDFYFEVNGVAIFCKGGDWIPPDHLYARASADRLRKLVWHAQQANFNMLRIWGGGIYERDAFYDACDEAGILIWHDFMFGCSPYPDHRTQFCALVEKELQYQTTRLATHPCMALWCGNNENHWIYYQRPYPYDNDRQFGLMTANDMCVRAVRANCPHIPYWNSSPYGGAEPNDPACGDVHHWHACFMHPDIEKRIDPFAYDELPASFVSEYGYIGPCCEETMRQYFDGAPVDMESDIWRLHTNTYEKQTVAAGVLKHYGRTFTDMETYIYNAGMVQSMMYNYSLEALRSKPYCGGALFWMFNDTWGETGWTIVDPFLRRKPGYYGVKRAFAPVRLILRRDGDRIVITGCNETAENREIVVRLGITALSGEENTFVSACLSVPARSRGPVMCVPLPDADWTRSVFAVLPEDSDVAPAALRMTETVNQQLPTPDFTATCTADGDDLLLTLTAKNYVHGLMLTTDGNPEDSGFDLLPSETRTLRIIGTNTPPRLRLYFPAVWEGVPTMQ